jgi:protein LSM12
MQITGFPTSADRVEGADIVGFDGVLPSISRVDHNAMKVREEAAIRKIKERDASRPKGVSKEGYGVFDAVART